MKDFTYVIGRFIVIGLIAALIAIMIAIISTYWRETVVLVICAIPVIVFGVAFKNYGK